MNETSNVSLPHRSVRRGLAATLFAGFTATVAGCPGPTPHAGNGGSGGDDSKSSSTSSSSTSTSSSSTSSSSSSSSSSGAMMCSNASDCPTPTNVCKLAVCENNTCALQPATAKTPCDDNGGMFCDGKGHCVSCVNPQEDCPSAPSCQVAICTSEGACGTDHAQAGTSCQDSGGHVCDGAGKCVACVKEADCANASTTLCVAGVYTPMACAADHTCVPGTPQNCGMMGKICTSMGCDSCTADVDCGPQVQGACQVNKCEGGTCKLGPAPQASDCLLAATNNPTCNANGVCVSAKYVFVTSTAFPANLGGASGADDKCNTIAAGAGLGGKWWSWTSDSTTWPAKRFMAQNSSAPYKLLDDTTIVANNWADLVDGTLANAITMDEHHAALLQQVPVWTGTNPDGTYAGNSCDGWAGGSAATGGTTGLTGQTSSKWTNQTATPCSGSTAHLYCFQQ